MPRFQGFTFFLHSFYLEVTTTLGRAVTMTSTRERCAATAAAGARNRLRFTPVFRFAKEIVT